jgi:hypothetical protein
VDYYRELNLDDPFRKNERENPSAKDDGDLYGLRPRARRLRVLLDIESLKQPSAYAERETNAILGALLQDDLVRGWRIDMSKVNQPEDENEAEHGTVYLHSNKPGSMGPYGAPGPSYALRVITDDKNRSFTSISPFIDIMKDIKDLDERGPKAVGVTPDDVFRNVLLTKTAQQTKMDIVVSQAITVGRTDIPSNYQANVFTPGQAIQIIAHYLRTQQTYLLNPGPPRYIGSRRAFYQNAVCAMAPRIWHWLGGCQHSLDSRYLHDTREMIGRLNRALKAFDDLLFHMGSFPNSESFDDIGDCIDRVLVSLCGAVDVMARSLHHALRLSDTARNAKLHNKRWYTQNIGSIYANANGIQQLDDAQELLETVFWLRNTIHSTALQATGASSEPASYVEVGRGRMNLIVPHDTYQDLSQDERTAWGLSVVQHPETGNNVAAADLAMVAETALNRVFRFLDRLCWVASFEQVPNCADLMGLDVKGAMGIISPAEMMLIPRLLGLQSAAHDDQTDAPYSLHPTVAAYYAHRQQLVEQAEQMNQQQDQHSPVPDGPKLKIKGDSSSRDESIMALRQAGKSLRAIAAEVGCSASTVSRVIKKHS